MRHGFHIFTLCVFFVFTSCSGAEPPHAPQPETQPQKTETQTTLPISAPPSFPTPAPETVTVLSAKDEFIGQLMERMTLEQKIGQMLIVSFDGLTEIDKSSAEVIEKYQPGGIIYFALNIDTEQQTRKLSGSFREISEIPPFIAVDEEGGRVSRITKSGKIDTAKIPPAKEIGNTGDSQKAFDAALSISETLKRLGINVDFAPCADLDSDNAGVIGDRAYSGDPAVAGEFAAKAVEGFTEGGIISSIKHFPGHGIAPGDTHEAEILAEKSLAEILSCDVVPFKICIESGVPLVMMSHITVGEWGGPSSLSADAVSYVRETLGFGGPIITDALNMGAITEYYPSGEAAVKAVNAGVNILLIPEDTAEAFDELRSSVKNGKTNIDKIDSSVEKILSLKYDYGFFDF